MLAVFFDLEKSYDTTSKYDIRMKLYDIGIKGALPTIIQSFLADRKLECRWEIASLSWKISWKGIPQGSVLSVTLFAIAIDDTVKVVSCSL